MQKIKIFIKRMVTKMRCTWEEVMIVDEHKIWIPQCDQERQYETGKFEDLIDVKDGYKFCCKCGKEIDFKPNPNWE